MILATLYLYILSLFLSVGGHGSKDLIPQPGRHAKCAVGIFEVMQIVVLPDVFEPIGRIVFVDGIMDIGIHQISDKPAGEKCPDIEGGTEGPEPEVE